MTYYHVAISFVGTRGRSGYESRCNIKREELEERFIRPYQLGTSVVINGVAIRADEIRRISIYSTQRNLGKHDDMHKGDDVTNELITGPPGTESVPDVAGGAHPRPPTDAREVFVVHGRNEPARKAMFEFLRAVGLHPLEWSEAVRATGRPTPYIGEILNAAFSRAHAVVVLLTPDDEARLRESLRVGNEPPHEVELSGQARPNVLFEAGMAMGQDEDRTVLVELGEMRPFSDIAGRHVIRLDNSSQRRQELAQRLQAAGCPVKLDGTDWHSAGDFDGALKW